MRPFIFSPDAGFHIDPPVDSLLRQIPDRTMGMHDADVALVPITKFAAFKFNPALFNLNKPWVLVDYVENGWDWNQEETMLFGHNTEKFFGHEYNDEWRKFDAFVRDHPPILTFKRELLEKDRTDKLLPIDYTAWLPEHPLDSREDFLKRPLQVSFNFGRSHEGRMMMHGAIFAEAGRFGYSVISEWGHVEREMQENNGLKWLSVHVPHYNRIDVRDVQKYIRMSKITVNLNGCGVKTFRSTETCGDAIMAMPENKLAWAYPWNSQNSIVLPDIRKYEDAQEAVKVISDALMRPDLYEIYAAGVNNGRNYRFDGYLRRHVVGNIEKHL